MADSRSQSARLSAGTGGAAGGRGTLDRKNARPEEPKQRNFGTIDGQLASSRNGVRWNRAGDETGTMVGDQAVPL